MSVAHFYIAKILCNRMQLHAIYIKNKIATHMQKMVINVKHKQL